MSQQTPPQTRQALLEAAYEQFRQADGTYLLRPYFPFSPTYKVDVAVKDRWLRFHRRSPWVAVPAMFLVLAVSGATGFLGKDDSFAMRLALVFVLLLVAMVMAVFTSARVIFRHAQRVPAGQWKRPGIFLKPEMIPRSRLRVLALIALAVGEAAVVAGAILLMVMGPAETFWSSLQLALSFGAFFLVTLLKLLVRAGRVGAMIEDAVMVLFLGWLIAAAPASFWPLKVLVLPMVALFIGSFIRLWRKGLKPS
jgi:hypothetical protein